MTWGEWGQFLVLNDYDPTPLEEKLMTKEMKIKALARIQQAAQKFKDDETLGEAVREALAELAAEEKAHRETAKAEHEANLAKKQA